MTDPSPMPNAPQVLIVTGMSGAGRSSVGKFLEDLGYLVIDNLPVSLIHQVIRLHDVEEGQTNLAVIIDARHGLNVGVIVDPIEDLRGHGIKPVVLFLDARSDVISKRYDEVRRPHPVVRDTVLESIESERVLLEPLREIADVVIDTSEYSVHDLRQRITSEFEDPQKHEKMRVSVRSFGYKHGHPTDTNLMFDVRFLPNPYWVPELRDLTGLDEGVRDYVLGNPDAVEFFQHATSMLEFLLPRYEAEGKSYLSIGVGCTGGRHRSVAITEALGRWLSDWGASVSVRHRDVGR
jgi:UPF0042 nucleotide-binding protein